MAGRLKLGHPEGVGRRRPRSAISDDVDLTPMIDVVFQLLIFFTLTSTFAEQSDVELPVARHGQGVNPEGTFVVALREPTRPGEEAPLSLGGGKGPPITLDVFREELGRAVGTGVTQVMIKAARKVPTRDVMAVAEVVGEFEGTSIFIAVEEMPPGESP